MATSDHPKRTGEVVQLLITNQSFSNETTEQIIEELSESFGGSMAFSTDCSWLDRDNNLRTGSAVSVEFSMGSNQEGTDQ